MTATVREPDEILLGFTRALRAAGVPVTQDRAQGFLGAVALVGLDDAAATYVAGRATLCASPDDLARYDQVHEAYFNARDGLPRSRPGPEGAPTFSGLPLSDGDGGEAGETDEDVVRAMASDTEVCGTATSRACRRQRRRGSPRCSRRCGRARPAGVRLGTGAGTAARSTPRARCGPACAGSASPPTSPGAAAGTSHAAWCFWWTCPDR